MCGFGFGVPKIFQYTRLGLPLALLLTILLVSCRGADTSVPPTKQPDNLQSPQKIAVPLHPNAFFHFQKISLEEGLSQSVVNVILQDRRGYLWFGTQDGLNRYDGFTFKIYKSSPEDPNSISDGWVESLFEDKEGNIWIGTYQGGLNKYDPHTDTFTRYFHNPKEPDSIGSGTIFAILQDRSGVLWAGSEDGLNKFDPVTGTFTHYRNDPDNPDSLGHNNIHAIYQDQKGILWIGTLGGGLERFNPLTGRFQHFRAKLDTKNAISEDVKVGTLEAKNAISNNIVRTIIEDTTGSLWIGTEKGLNRFDLDSGQFRHYMTSNTASSISNNSVLSLLIDDTGRLWVGTEFGLNHFDKSTGEFVRYFSNPFIPNTLSSNSISSLYEDREGILWAGTWGGGVNKHSPAQDKFIHYGFNPESPTEFPAEGIFSIYADPSGVAWIGSLGEGLTRFDPVTGQTTRYEHDPDDPDSLNASTVKAVYRDHTGTLWVGTSYGLDQMDERSGKFTHHTVNKEKPWASIRDNNVSILYESLDNKFWIGTDKGVDLYNRSTGMITHITDLANPNGATSQNVTAILHDHDGFLWVGTFGMGAYRLDLETNAFRYYQNNVSDPKSLGQNVVLSIYQDTLGTIWLGTAGGGLNKYDPITDSFIIFTNHQGLPDNVIYCIIPGEQETLWLTTNYGLSHFNPRTMTFQNYTINDGLQSNEFNPGACSRSANGDIYVGGINGINLFTPSKIRTNNYIPPVTLTSLTQNEKDFHTTNSIEDVRELVLKWPENSFEFEFASLSFAEPKRNQQAYMLENFDTDWKQIGNKREGRYTNLSGGEYILRLRGSNNDGIWNETGAAIKITVIPPFWQTWWFYTLAGLMVIASVWVGYRLRVHGIEAHRRELEHEVQERTQEIEHLFEQTKELAIIEERNRLARDLHDSAKQKAFAALAQIGTAGGIIQNNPKAAREHLNEAENLVYDVIQELTFLIQEMYPLALKEKGLGTSVREYLYEWENRTDIPVSVHIEGERRLPLKVEQALYRISQESLANVARHSHANKVEVAMDYGDETICLSISDNGCGFDPQQKPNGIGLRSIRERAESISGQVTIESTIGKGTCVNVIIPGKAISGE